jgi:hypothetical protein
MRIGIGMPQALLLNEFGSQVWSFFGEPPYLVGSALYTKRWRDVDIRLILSDKVYADMGFGCPSSTHTNHKWVSACLAYSALGKSMTGLPIDFQIQQQSHANRAYPGPRNGLGHTPLRIHRDE